MENRIRTLSPQESRIVLALTEGGRREATRSEIMQLLGGSAKATDHVIESLRRKGWLERATWGEYLLIPPDQGPDILGDSNLLARVARADERGGDSPDAVKALIRAVQLNPQSRGLRHSLARALLTAGRYGEADRLYRDLLQSYPNDVEALINAHLMEAKSSAGFACATHQADAGRNLGEVG